MPRRIVPEDLSDDDFDELIDDGEEVKPDLGPLAGALPRPRHVTTSCKQLHDLIHTGTVELSPSYQRDVVWPEAKMIMLVQSLMLNYYIPPLLFAITTNDETGEEMRVCIDGKQRCTAILRFMDGEIPFITPNRERLYYRRMVNQRGKQLPENLRKKFDMIQIQAVEYDRVSDEVQRDLFQRVQMGAPLSPAEKLQAIPGPWSTWITELMKKYALEPDTLVDTIKWDTLRGKPFQHIASTILLVYNPNSRKTVSATDVRKWLERSDGPDENFRRKMEMTLSLFVRISIEYHNVAFESVEAKVAPVEFWFIGYIIFTRMGSSTVATLAKHIGDLRRALRAANRDIFTNSKIVGWIFNWLDKLPVEKPAPGQQVAAIEWEGEEVANSETLAKKRKRQQRDEEEDPDYRGGPVPRFARSDVVGNTRSGAAAATRPATTTTRAGRVVVARNPSPPAKPVIPPPPAARPPPNAMDAPSAGSFGNFAQNLGPNAAQGYRSFNYAQPGLSPNVPHAQIPNQQAAPPQHQAQAQPSQQIGYNPAALQQQTQQRAQNTARYQQQLAHNQTWNGTRYQ